MQRRTVEEVEKDIEKNKQRWLAERKRKYPSFACDDEKLISIYLCGRWLSSMLKRSGLSKRDALPIYALHTFKLATELSMTGKRSEEQVTLKVTVDSWNAYVKERKCERWRNEKSNSGVLE